MNSSASDLDWDERTSAPRRLVNHTDDVFDSLFERSADAIWLYDPETSLLVDCNRAAVELIGAKNKRSQISLERFGAIKTGEEETAYYGEPPKLDFVYAVSKEDWKNIGSP